VSNGFVSWILVRWQLHRQSEQAGSNRWKVLTEENTSMAQPEGVRQSAKGNKADVRYRARPQKERGPGLRLSFPHNSCDSINVAWRWVLAVFSVACGIDPVLLVPPGFWLAYFSASNAGSIKAARLRARRPGTPREF
jgi:hypothetical protein